MADSIDDLIWQLRDLEIQQAAIICRLAVVQTREREARCEAEATRVLRANFCIGDRVEITNEVKSFFGRPVTINDCRGTVMKLTKQHVVIQTYNGATVYQAPTNVQHISKAN